MADKQLYQSVEKVFSGTEARVVAAYKVRKSTRCRVCLQKLALSVHLGTVLQVQKCSPSTTSTFSAKKKPPKVQ